MGVVGDVRQTLTEAPRPELYLSTTQGPPGDVIALVRTRGDPHRYIAAARAAVARVDPDQPVFAVRTLEEIRSGAVGRQRFAMLLLSLFAGQALLLAGLGIYGVIAYTVGRRRREIGIRIAVGAMPHEVVGLVVGQGVTLALLGVGLGGAAALGLSRLLAGLLYDVRSADPWVFGGIALLLTAVATAASTVPALRATRIDPTTALRME